MTKKKLLCLFDSYPTEKIKLGTFYQSQISLLKDHFDVQVIIINGETTSLYSWYKTKLVYDKPYFDEVNQINVYPVTVRSPFNDRWLRNIPKLNRKILNTHKLIISENLFDFQKLSFDKKPDLVYAQTAQYLLPFAVIFKEKLNIPLVVNEHYPLGVQMTNLWDVSNPDFKIMVRKASEGVDNFMAVSDFLATNLYLFGIRKKFNITGNYLKEYPVNYSKKDKNSEFRVLYIGYSHFIKGAHTFFKAVNMLKLIDKNIKFLVLSTFDNFKKFIDLYDLQDVVDVRTSVPHSEVIRIMNEEASVFISTSLAENWPVSIAEAIINELPVITTNNGGNMDYITKKNAIIIDRESPEQIVDAILKVKNGEVNFDFKKNREELLANYGKEAFTKTLLKNIYSTKD